MARFIPFIIIPNNQNLFNKEYLIRLISSHLPQYKQPFKSGFSDLLEIQGKNGYCLKFNYCRPKICKRIDYSSNSEIQVVEKSSVPCALADFYGLFKILAIEPSTKKDVILAKTKKLIDITAKRWNITSDLLKTLVYDMCYIPYSIKSQKGSAKYPEYLEIKDAPNLTNNEIFQILEEKGLKEAKWTELSYRFISQEKRSGPIVGLNVEGILSLKPSQKYKWTKMETWIWTSLIIKSILNLRIQKSTFKCNTINDY